MAFQDLFTLCVWSRGQSPCSFQNRDAVSTPIGRLCVVGIVVILAITVISRVIVIIEAIIVIIEAQGPKVWFSDQRSLIP